MLLEESNCSFSEITKISREFFSKQRELTDNPAENSLDFCAENDARPQETLSVRTRTFARGRRGELRESL